MKDTSHTLNSTDKLYTELYIPIHMHIGNTFVFRIAVPWKKKTTTTKTTLDRTVHSVLIDTSWKFSNCIEQKQQKETKQTNKRKKDKEEEQIQRLIEWKEE